MSDPNFSMDLPSQKGFMEKHPELDFYVPIEGEVGFSNSCFNILEFQLRTFS